MDDTMKITPGLMDQIHQCGQELLDAFAQICEENHLRYYLIAGTLLGAIRHKGPIPWDDDVDVCMPRADFEKFKEIMLARPEDELYHIHCRDNDPDYPQRLMRLKKRGTVYSNQFFMDIDAKYQELWLDIFPLDDAPGKLNFGYRFLSWRLAKVKDAIYTRALVHTDGFRWTGKAFHSVLRHIPIKVLIAHDEKLMRKYEKKNCDHYMSWGSKYGILKQTMPKSWYGSATKIEYSGKLYSAPQEWDKVLTKLYGDYMKLPPESERGGHGAIDIKM